MLVIVTLWSQGYAFDQASLPQRDFPIWVTAVGIFSPRCRYEVLLEILGEEQHIT